MSEEQLNIKYICENTGLVENDKLIPIILGMIKASYKAGLTQAEIDNTMGLIEENQKYKEVIDKAITYMKDFTFEPLLTCEDRKLIMYNENLKKFEDILKGVNND